MSNFYSRRWLCRSLSRLMTSLNASYSLSWERSSRWMLHSVFTRNSRILLGLPFARTPFWLESFYSSG
jgi:hypothetical protein